MSPSLKLSSEHDDKGHSDGKHLKHELCPMAGHWDRMHLKRELCPMAGEDQYAFAKYVIERMDDSGHFCRVRWFQVMLS